MLLIIKFGLLFKTQRAKSKLFQSLGNPPGMVPEISYDCKQTIIDNVWGASSGRED